MYGILSITGAAWLFALLLLPLLAFFAGCAAFNLRLVLAAIPARRGRASRKGAKAQRRKEEKGREGEGERGNRKERSRFLVLIPAHDEELLLGDTLTSLAAMDYPRDAYDVLVVADNCTDRTAEIARESGAMVLERHDTSHIGKGYALNYALQYLSSSFVPLPSLCAFAPLREAPAFSAAGGRSAFSAVVLLDADTLVQPNLLSLFAEGLARGEKAQQACYQVRNPDAGWRTRLLTCALALIHVAKPLGREHLQLSDSLKGNGMCFAWEVAERIPWNGDALAEDLDYTLRLVGEGIRVAFRPETAVYAAMPGSSNSAATQRRRWEAGRWQVLRKAPTLLREGIRTRNRLLTDRALDLFVPPFAERFAACLALALLAAMTAHFTRIPLAALCTGGFLAIIGIEIITLAIALRIARVPRSAVLALLFAPVYLLWKFGLLVGLATRRTALRWQRTERT